jgi:DNA primase catalytic subunit
MPRRYRVSEVDEDEDDEETTESPDVNEGKEPSTETKENKQQERQKRKSELEAELKGLEDELKSEAAEAADNIAEDDPDRSAIASEAKDEAAAIATGHNLSKEEEARLTKAITADVMEKIGNENKPSPRPSRVPDRKPKPTHWSERRILSRNRGSD